MRRPTYPCHRSAAHARAAIAVVVSTAFIAGVPGEPARAVQPTLGQPPGYAVYVVKGCYECHGYRGQGSLYSGPAIAPNTPTLAVMTAYLRTPSGQMPPYSSAILSDAEVSQIRDYLSSLPAPRPPAKIGLLPRISGRTRGTDGANPARSDAAHR